MSPIPIIIPAYQPTVSLIELVHSIKNVNSDQIIIIVDDGSNFETQTIFSEIAIDPTIIILKHAVNLGKGQALKTAFNFCLLNYKQAPGVITADADGQHAVEDIQQMRQAFIGSPHYLWLGSRTLNKQAPLKSRVGNALTRNIFSGLMGKAVYDTQTGLRAIPLSLLAELLLIPTNRYEFELDMLIHAIQKKCEIKELPIRTIYIDDNKGSHFNPIVDSVKVYFVFIRYLLGSISSAVIDFFCFTIAFLISQKIFFSLTLARVISGTFNFLICKKLIFKSDKNIYLESLKYSLLAVFSLMLAYIIVLGLSHDYGFNIYLSKIIADVAVFLINFALQRVLIFSPLFKN